MTQASSTQLDIAVLRRKLERERRAREQAEALLETRAAELREGTLWLQEAAARLTANQQHLRAVLDAAQEAILTFDENGQIHDTNVACERLFRFKPDEMRGLTIDRLVPELRSKLRPLLEKARRLAESGSLLRGEAFAQTAGAEVVPVMLTVRPIDASVGHDDRYVALITDRSTEEAIQAQLKQLLEREQSAGLAMSSQDFHQASHSALRQWYDKQLDEARIDTGECHVALICSNVDRFKRVNDNLGFEAGDAVIEALTDRINGFLAELPPTPQAKVAFCRLFADQFVFAVVSPTPLTLLEDWTGALRAHLGEPIETYAQRFVFSFSVGASVSRLQRSGFQDLLVEADFAMRRAKLRGGNGYHAYSLDTDSVSQRSRTTEHNVILGIERRQFQPFFQPKVCSQTGRILGFEALLRWQHPELGLIPLGEFLPVLENSSLMLDVGLQIFEQVVSTMTQWQAQGCYLPVSFNLSNGELLSDVFREQMVAMVHKAGIDPSLICLEITETVLANLGESGDIIFASLRKEGFCLSMDDFGVGTSSLSRLKSIPLREIKVDRSFVNGIGQSRRDTDLLRGIVNLARSLGLEVVLEGVESEQQLRVARSMGNLAIQGFYFSKAVDHAQALELIRTRPFELH